MRRTAAIAKYAPVLLCGLLMVAWASSFFVALGARFPAGRGRGVLYLENACLTVSYRSPPTDWVIQFLGDEGDWQWRMYKPSPLSRWAAIGGRIDWSAESAASVSNARWYRLQMPIPLLLVFAIPLAAAPFTRFRFPLWAYFAWIALLGAALAYYWR